MARGVINDLIGVCFGRWTVIRRAGSDKYGKAAWLCRCVCGVEKVLRSAVLRHGESTSCGCYRQEVRCRSKSHGCAHHANRSPEYSAWSSMVARCTNMKNPYFSNYGGRGIGVCRRWRKSFENFLADMGSRPSALHSLDRIDNSKGYGPANCRWATKREQQRNTRANRKVTLNGQRKCVSEWSAQNGLKVSTVYGRLARGWTMRRALGVAVSV